MVLITASYLWIALHFHDLTFNWWIGVLVVFLDMLLISSSSTRK